MPEPQDSFNDLPDEQTPEDNEEASEVGDDVGTDDAPEDKQRKEEEIRKLTIAAKKEDMRIAKLKETLSAKRKEAKALRQETEKGDDAEEEAPSQEDVIKKTIESTLQEKEAGRIKHELVTKIRGIAKTKQEAEMIMAEAEQFPANWSVDDRLAFARQRVQMLRERTRGFVAPSAAGAATGFEDMGASPTGDEVPGMSPERVAYLKKLGWTVEDIKKYKDGPDLGRIWPGEKVLVNNK